MLFTLALIFRLRKWLQISDKIKWTLLTF